MDPPDGLRLLAEPERDAVIWLASWKRPSPEERESVCAFPGWISSGGGVPLVEAESVGVPGSGGEFIWRGRITGKCDL
jgi:hypothetical protein